MWNSGPGWCRGAYLTTYCFRLLGWKFFSWFFITSCNVFFTCTTLEHLFYSEPYAFSLIMGKFAYLWPFWPIFHGVFCYEFPLWVQFWVVHLSKRTGVYFTTNCFGTLLWTFFPSFPSQAVECFLQVLVLSTFLQWALSFFPYVGKNLHVCGHFWPYFHSVFCYRFPSWAQFWFYDYPQHPILQILRISASFRADFLFNLQSTWFLVIWYSYYALLRN